jgi:hypothetical protein
VSSGINILGRDTRHAALEANNILVRNNLFANVSGRAFGGVGRFLLINGGANVTIDHNTALVDGDTAVFADVNAVSGFVFTNNLLFDHGLGVKGSGAAAGVATVARYFPGSYFMGNIIAGANPALYPGGNYYPSIAGVGFADYNSGNYRLSHASPFKRAATDGLDPGCNFDALTGMGGTVPPLGPAPQTPALAPASAPRSLSARVVGNTVTLTWAVPASGTAVTYIVEAGSAPGLSNAARANVGATTSIVVPNVPAATYYVRVIAANGSAVSAASNEVVVTVP